MKYSLLYLVFIVSSVNLFCQNNTQKLVHFNLFDAYLQPNNQSIFNGKEYIDVYPEQLIKQGEDNKFYGSYDFIKGTVIYNGLPYFDVELKYELLNDLLLIKYVNEKVNLLTLNSEMVDEFKLQGDTFKKLYGNHFFKEIYNGNVFALYIKFSKIPIEKMKGPKVRYSFSESSSFVVKHKSKYYQIKSKKNVLNAFPHLDNEIRLYYKNNSALMRKDKEQFYLNLLKYLYSLSSQNKDI